jgi:hemolysin-activating ACP:hemolysin acyltransferase
MLKPATDGLHSRYLEADVKLGPAVALLFNCGRGRFSVASAYVWLMPPILLDQILFVPDEAGRLLGYVTWAYVSTATLERLRADEANFLELPEWNEGAHLWIADIVARPGQARRVVRALIARKGEALRAEGLRRRPDGAPKRMAWVERSRQARRPGARAKA